MRNFMRAILGVGSPSGNRAVAQTGRKSDLGRRVVTGVETHGLVAFDGGDDSASAQQPAASRDGGGESERQGQQQRGAERAGVNFEAALEPVVPGACQPVVPEV